MSNSAGVDSVEKLRIGEGKMRTGAVSRFFVVALLLAAAAETHAGHAGHVLMRSV